MKQSRILNSAGRPANEAPTIVSPTGTPVTSEKPTPTEAEAVKLEIKPDAEGYVYRWSDNPKKPGQLVLYDVDGKIHAICEHPAVAEMICEALRMLALAARASAAPAPTTTPEGA